MSQKLDQGALVRGLRTVIEDLFFGVAAAGRAEEETLTALLERRHAVYDGALSGGETTHVSAYREWVSELAAAAAPVCSPVWLPMSDLVKGGLTLEGGARGVRSLFTSKPSEKTAVHVRRVGTLAVRVLTSVLGADGELDADERDMIAAFVASLGLDNGEARALLDEPPIGASDIEEARDLDPKHSKAIIAGAWLAAAGDGIDPREDRTVALLGEKLGVHPTDVESARTAAKKTVEEQRDVGVAVIDAIRYLLVDEPDHALTLGKIGARLFLPRRYRLEPLSALYQRGTVTLVHRNHLDRVGQEVVRAASWLAALYSDPSVSRRVTLVRRHENIAKDLQFDGNGAAPRDMLERLVETHLAETPSSAAPGAS